MTVVPYNKLKETTDGLSLFLRKENVSVHARPKNKSIFRKSELTKTREAALVFNFNLFGP